MALRASVLRCCWHSRNITDVTAGRTFDASLGYDLLRDPHSFHGTAKLHFFALFLHSLQARCLHADKMASIMAS